MNAHDSLRWRCTYRLEKYDPQGRLHQVIQGEGNVLTTTGINALWTALTGGSITAFNNANARIGVGDGNGSVPSVSASDTDLTATTNKLRKGMDATYPSVSLSNVTFRSTFGSADANFAWNEWGIFNSSSGGTMLNHKGQAFGTKVAGATWILSVTLSLT